MLERVLWRNTIHTQKCYCYQP